MMSRINKMLLGPEQLAALLAERACVVVDCRFDLLDVNKGRQGYLEGHIPGAHYAHLDHDLASPITELSGRHPLPDTAEFATFLSKIGWDSSRLLVAHDDGNNALASRLWWLMRYFGQDAALLDGGFNAWSQAGLPLEAGEVGVEPSAIMSLQPDPNMTVSLRTIKNQLDQPSLTLVDARAPERYSGEFEPLDTQAGHIPGALNRPLGLNVDESGRFKSPDALRAEFEKLLGDRPLESVVHSCGSGVTACHNRFAMELAGLTDSRVYPGSWSEWSRDPSRPIETGR
jgi:thiosulfate/3-mercaptopyruvate sulfurtransferase